MKRELNHFLIVDKPHGWSSFDCVNKIAWTLKNGLDLPKKPKVGHSGTLDPYATGVLVVAVGKATKRIEELKGVDKDYVAEITFGLKSETYDLDGQIEVGEWPEGGWGNFDIERVKSVLKEFEGEIDQVPPRFSALKVDGKRAYDLARQGKDFELKARKVHIERLDFLEEEFKAVIPGSTGPQVPTIKVFMTVSTGTYVRSLARDIGERLQVPALLSSLRRTRVGGATLDGELPVVKISKEITFEQLEAALIDISTLL